MFYVVYSPKPIPVSALSRTPIVQSVATSFIDWALLIRYYMWKVEIGHKAKYVHGKNVIRSKLENFRETEAILETVVIGG
jgi:hypothetical protein